MGKPAYSERLSPRASLPSFRAFLLQHIDRLRLRQDMVQDVGIDGAGFFVSLNLHVDRHVVRNYQLPTEYQNYPIRYQGAQHRSIGELAPEPPRTDPRTYSAPTVARMPAYR